MLPSLVKKRGQQKTRRRRVHGAPTASRRNAPMQQEPSALAGSCREAPFPSHDRILPAGPGRTDESQEKVRAKSVVAKVMPADINEYLRVYRKRASALANRGANWYSWEPHCGRCWAGCARCQDPNRWAQCSVRQRPQSILRIRLQDNMGPVNGRRARKQDDRTEIHLPRPASLLRHGTQKDDWGTARHARQPRGDSCNLRPFERASSQSSLRAQIP